MFGGSCGNLLAEVFIFDAVNFDIHVDTVKERTRELFLVILNLGFGASTEMGRVAEVTTGARVHGGD